MATEPPSPLRLEAPGPPEMRTPPASETAPEGTPKSAGGRLRFLNGCVPLSHQVAGHMYGKDKVGILQHPDGTVLKQLQPPPRGPRELEFYNMVSEVFAADCTDDILLELQKYLPKYYGIWSPPTAPNVASLVLEQKLGASVVAACVLTCSEACGIFPDQGSNPCSPPWQEDFLSTTPPGKSQDLYLKLEDVTHKFNKPCIMDVKIGRKSYDPFASSEKIQQQVYHVHSDSYETKNQHYGRSLTKETLKDGVSHFFHNGFCLRRDAIAASIQKIEKILQWFESQKQLNFYASSLLFVYEGSSQPTTTKLNDRTLAEKFLSKGQLSDTDVLEYNNNFHVLNSTANGKIEASVGKSLSKMYACHRKMYSKKHHSQTSLKAENIEQDNGWKSMSQERLNGNVLSQLEKVFYHLPTGCQETAEVEVRMIDFAHVFPSNTVDEGYVYGLKHLITVLQSILDN
ncbi:inositol polyphosphate multikinase isoform X3 [Bubalus bubalis]|uniref:inositol polyphosphate multikinase isoform X3 n=1 Tax=Bubalus bubalis TaxID=89462 RepID=UPI000DBC6DC0|nr:inositol polyphosphate multikinase isoform X3 [Bubalus bubalis]